MISIKVEKEIVCERMSLNVENRSHEPFKRIDGQPPPDLSMCAVKVLQIPDLILCIFRDLFESLYVFSLNEQLVVSSKLNEWVEIVNRTSFELFLRVIYDLYGNYRLLDLFKHLRIEAGLLLGEYCAQILVIDHFVIQTEFYKCHVLLAVLLF